MSETACPDPGQIAGFVEDRLLPREREAVESHLARCADCRAAALSMTEVRRAPVLRLWMAAVPVAAAILLAVLRFPAGAMPSSEVALAAAARDLGFRPLDHGERIAPALLPKRGGALPLLRPAGKVLDLRPEFRWEPVPGIETWEVALSTADGTLLWSEKATGASLRFPGKRDSLRPGARYLLEVRGEGPLGTERSRRVFAVASDGERAAFERGLRDLDARGPAAIRSLLKAHLALRAGLPSEAEAPARAALAAAPADPVARETLDRVLEDLGEAPR